MAPTAHALTFSVGDIEGQFDSSLSAGISWSTTDADAKLIGTTNGGKSAASANDDGRLNFRRGKPFSTIVKGLHDLDLKYANSGVFLRGKYWYDYELKHGSRPHKEIDDSGRDTAARTSGAMLLDAFAYHNYSIDNLPGTVRLGRQVVSWGESTFIGNSINSINPIDVAAFRRPGAELKEGLLPVNMFFVSQAITDRLSTEVFYQLKWEPTVVDNCGTFFAPDTVAKGCNDNFTVGTADAVDALMPFAGFMNVRIEPEGLVVPRGKNNDARDDGQWGLALRWLGDAVEYGAYAMNYHSRLPYLSMTTPTEAAIAYAAGLPGGFGGVLGQTSLLGNSQYFMDYPEDIRLYGVSFATNLPTGTAWSGEISYRPNMPLAINTIDATNAAVISVIDGAISGGFAGALATADQDVRGYKRKDVTQAQTTLVHFLDRVMGAERLTLIGEFAVTRLGGLESRRDVRYGRITEVGPYDGESKGGFYTASSWGYRARAALTYSDVFAGVNLTPNVSWAHDVHGYGPVFNQGARAISLGLDAEYRGNYTASLSYTNFFGGKYNNQTDRDFLALSVGVNF